MNEQKILITKPSKDYELIDSGDGEKLERFGDVTMRRPDPQALWHKNLPEKDWNKADAIYARENKSGMWRFNRKLPDNWIIDFSELKLLIRPTSFKHTGLFPEQSENWNWMREQIAKAFDSGEKEIEVLNLFGYTGGATLACAQAGAKVVHVDGSKVAITWGNENADASGLKDKPIRWILDDVQGFVGREIKRGRKYHGILLDPPAFGHGPKKEMWKIEEHFTKLLEDCFKLLADKPVFFLVNGYAAGYSSITYKNNLISLIKKYGGDIEIGELVLEESNSKRLLPCGIFARWKR